MAGLRVFFEAFDYLTGCLEQSLEKLRSEQLAQMFEVLIHARSNGCALIVDGQGRSLQSLLLAEDCMEHNGFPLILPTSNANLRPWKRDDVFFFNSGSGTGSPIRHAEEAAKDGLMVIGMTYNKKLEEKFPRILVLEASKNQNKKLAPLGTEFEFTSAVIGTCLGYSVQDDLDASLEGFFDTTRQLLHLFKETRSYYEEQLDSLMRFIEVVSSYLPKRNRGRVYFCGVGRDEIINRVAAIRYGHLAKEPDLDLRVIYEGHWGLRQKDDLAILTSGSGATTQVLQYALQAFVSGMRIFGVTSFADSDLGKFCTRVDGCLVIPGRRTPFSMYNLPTVARSQKDAIYKTFLPEFELNTYITLDSLLAQIAENNNITDDDMREHHRPKVLES